MPDEVAASDVRPGVRVEVVHATPERVWSAVVEVAIGATASEALQESKFATLVPGFDATRLGYAIYGKPISASTILRDGDRLELLRPLIADPKQARRNRARRGR